MGERDKDIRSILCTPQSDGGQDDETESLLLQGGAMTDDATRYETMTPQEYAGVWGCDPVYDNPPRERGDGHLFYNYGAVDWPVSKRINLYKSLIPAIERTIKCVQQDPDSYEPLDAEDLCMFRDHVQSELNELGCT